MDNSYNYDSKETLAMKLRRSISVNLITNVFSTVVSFISMRILLEILGNNDFGLWLTLSSVVSWTTLLDGGLGNGIRNKLTESLSTNNVKLARIYVSTGYFTLFIIVSFFIVIYLIIERFLNWTTILNVDFLNNVQLSNIISIYIISNLVNFCLLLINQITYAKQDAYLPNIITLTNSVVFITVVLMVAKFSSGIKSTVIIYGITSILVTLIYSIVLFKKKYTVLIPSIKYIKIDKIREITNLSFRFFLLQVSSLIIFTTDSYIVMKLLGSTQVVEYQSINKLFSLITIVTTIILVPTWSAFTEAYTKKDYLWVKKAISNLIKLFIVLVIFNLIISFCSKFIISIWLGERYVPSTNLVILFSLYTIITCWTNIFANFLNGISKINIQLIVVAFGAIINIPFSVFFALKLDMGLLGVLSGTILAITLPAIVLPIQSYIIIKKMR